MRRIYNVVLCTLALCILAGNAFAAQRVVVCEMIGDEE